MFAKSKTDKQYIEHKKKLLQMVKFKKESSRKLSSQKKRK